MPTNTLRTVKYPLLCLPFILGLIGLLTAGESLSDSLYGALGMYLLQYQQTAPNLLTSLARWSAPLATVIGVLSSIPAVRERWRNFVRWRAGRSVAVYGPGPEKALLLAQLARRGIEGRDRFVRAGRYVLLDGEAENFLFWSEHHRQLEFVPVYLRCRCLPSQSVSDPMLRLFCPEETAARLFWSDRCLFELSAGCAHRMDIVFIGFGRLGEQLLNSALLCNIFSPEQQINYHVFGDCTSFTGARTQLGEIGDAVISHTEPWYDSLPLLEEAQAVIVLEQENQLELLKNLLLALRRRELDVFDAGGGECELLAGRDRLRLFAWRDRAFSPKYIFSDALNDRAKRINLRLSPQRAKLEDTQDARNEQWSLLDAFGRYSLISQADYHDIRVKMLAVMGQPSDPAVMSPELIDLLADLEHIRRCRYYYLSNYTAGVPENGSREDPIRRLSIELMSYASLPEEEKERRRETVRTLLSMK